MCISLGVTCSKFLSSEKIFNCMLIMQCHDMKLVAFSLCTCAMHHVAGISLYGIHASVTRFDWYEWHVDCSNSETVNLHYWFDLDS